MAIDADPHTVERARTRYDNVIEGDASDEEVLSLAGVERAAVLATVLSEDASNVFVTLTARAMNPAITIIARGENRHTETKLRTCGADKVVMPTDIGATRISRLIVRPTAEVRGAYGYLIVAVRGVDGTTVMHPPPDLRLSIGDRLIVLGYEDDLPQLGSKAPTRTVTYRGVTSEV